MLRSFVTMKYFETYYYANVIHNMLTEPFEYIRHLHSWYEDCEEELFLTPFPKRSLLHSFSEYVIESLIAEHVSDEHAQSFLELESDTLWIDEALYYHGFATQGFGAWLTENDVPRSEVDEDHISNYHLELRLSGPLEDLVEQLGNEVFYVLFGNRGLLTKLHDFVSLTVSAMTLEDVTPEFRHRLSADGKVKRVSIPQWARNAVFHRDRGLCSGCHSNLTGLVTAQTEDHFDHIVPLASGGINDVTNLQLLCGSCNLKKGSQTIVPSPRYEAWY